jgi:alpha/beta superfamily hydrolase
MERYVEIIRDGLTLRGMMHVPDDLSQPVGMVILLHGFCDDRNEINFVHTELSKRLCKDGIASVRFDMNGSGESDGRFEDMTVSSEIKDAEAMLAYVQAQDFVDPHKIALHGTSLGGAVASMVAGRHKDEIKALSMWCPAPDLIYNLREHKTLCGTDVSDIEQIQCADAEGLKMGYAFYQDCFQLDPYKDAVRFDKNVNIVHGDQDITASCQCSYKYKEIYQDRANLLIVPGAEHRFMSFAYRKARMESAENFLRKELK